jgi:hypothetical protein
MVLCIRPFLDVVGVLFTGYALARLIPLLTLSDGADEAQMHAWKRWTAAGTFVIMLGFLGQLIGVLLK